MPQQAPSKTIDRPVTGKRLIAVGGGKGGVGKSSFARALTDYYETRGIPVLPIDGDVENPTFSRFQRNAQPLFSQSAKGFEALINAMETGRAAQIVADLGAGTGHHMADFERALGLAPAAKEFGFQPVLVWLLAPSKDSIGLLGQAVQDHGRDWTYVIVRAMHKHGNWGLWENSNTKKAVDAFEPEVLDFPLLDADAFSALDKADLRFKDADRTKLGYAAAAYTVRWFAQVCRTLDNSPALHAGMEGKV
jgi:hypothetical protein